MDNPRHPPYRTPPLPNLKSTSDFSDLNIVVFFFSFLFSWEQQPRRELHRRLYIAQSDKIGMDLKQQTNRGHGRKRMLPYIPCTTISKSCGKSCFSTHNLLFTMDYNNNSQCFFFCNFYFFLSFFFLYFFFLNYIFFSFIFFLNYFCWFYFLNIDLIKIFTL